MKTKSAAVQVKAVGASEGLNEGEFKALVSVFGNTDRMGDRVVKGAFTDNIKAWEDSGDPIPVVWSHKWEDPFAHIGRVLKAWEDEDGLNVHGVIDDLDTNPTAAQVYRLLKGRRVKQFSFAYDELEAGPVKSEDDGDAYELRKLAVHEIGPCLLGVNDQTELLAAKAHALAKAGRVLSQKNLDTVVAARDALNDVIDAASTEDDGKAATMDLSEHSTGNTDQPSQLESVDDGKAEAVPGGSTPQGKAEADGTPYKTATVWAFKTLALD